MNFQIYTGSSIWFVYLIIRTKILVKPHEGLKNRLHPKKPETLYCIRSPYEPNPLNPFPPKWPFFDPSSTKIYFLVKNYFTEIDKPLTCNQKIIFWIVKESLKIFFLVFIL